VTPCVGVIGGIGRCYQQPGGVGGLAPLGDRLYKMYGVSACEEGDDREACAVRAGTAG
jgi:hypothetical protein